MAFLNETYNVDQLPQGNSYDAIPAGWYSAVIAAAEVKKTNAGTGSFIAVRYNITGPNHQGRAVFGNLNIKNPTPKAEEIGRQQLGEIMRSIGLSQVTDTDQLIGGRLEIKLTIKKDEQYGDGNEIKGFRALNGSTVPGSIPQTAPATSVPAASNGAADRAKAAPPWARK
jgi:hypothetical protein